MLLAVQMSALNDLRPFVRLCQIFGVIPFSMEVDPETKSFRRFRFSIKSITACFYYFAMVCQVVSFLVIGGVLWMQYKSAEYVYMHLPVAVALLNGSSQFIFFCVQVLKRVVFLRYRTLSRIVALIKEVDRHLFAPPECKSTVLKRTIVGLLFLISLVIFTLFQMLLVGLDKQFFFKLLGRVKFYSWVLHFVEEIDRFIR